METFDAVVVGGGPAGSTCARTLTRAGLKVAVLDRAVFPRDKVCGGWITPPVARLLALSLDEYRQDRVLQPILGFRTGRLGHRMIETRYPAAVSFGIRRCEFDHYLLQRSGAHLRCGHPVTTFGRLGDRWIVNDRMATPLLVGAGGHFCPVARWLNGSQRTDAVVATLEMELRLSAHQLADCRVQPDTPALYFCEDLKGYGWCFRKADFLNVGLGRQDSHRLPEHAGAFLALLKARQIVPPDLPAAWRGHAYLVRGGHSRRCVGDGVILIGDAAGVADPRSGEGIRPAIESARLAAATILAADGRYDRAALDPYQRRLQASAATGCPAGPLTRVVPARVRRGLAGALLESRWFTRHVLLDRWFLGGHRSPWSLAASRRGIHAVSDRSRRGGATSTLERQTVSEERP